MFHFIPITSKQKIQTSKRVGTKKTVQVFQDKMVYQKGPSQTYGQRKMLMGVSRPREVPL